MIRIGHRKEIRKLTFRALALHRSDFCFSRLQACLEGFIFFCELIYSGLMMFNSKRTLNNRLSFSSMLLSWIPWIATWFTRHLAGVNSSCVFFVSLGASFSSPFPPFLSCVVSISLFVEHFIIVKVAYLQFFGRLNSACYDCLSHVSINCACKNDPSNP